MAAGQFVLLVAGQAGVKDAGHLGMFFKSPGNGHRVVVLALDAYRQRLDPARQQSGAKRIEAAAEDPESNRTRRPRLQSAMPWNYP